MSALLYSQDFNAYTLNQAPPSPWISTPSTGGAVEVVADPAVGGGHGRVVRIFDNDASSRSVLRLDFTSAALLQRGTLLLEFSVYAAQANKQLMIGYRENQSGTPGGDFRLISMMSDGSFHYHENLNSDSSTVQISGTTYVADQWYKVKFAWDKDDQSKWSNNNLLCFWLNDVKKGTLFASSAANWFMDQIVFWTNPGQTAATFYIDDVKFGAAYSSAAIDAVRKRDGSLATSGHASLIRQSDNSRLATATVASNGTANFGADLILTESFDPQKCIAVVFGPAAGDGASARPDIMVA